ncbi:MAG: CDP-alcohol phosphatidyltransferase family protein [Pseudomonadota bacterium]
MFDARLRGLVDPPLNFIGRQLVRIGITANTVTLSGFAAGLLCVPLLALEYYAAALLLLIVNRLLDGVDGAVARIQGVTDLGGFLDIVLDFIFYSAFVFGLVLARPENAIAGAFLIFSFIGTGSSFLAYAIFAAKRHITTAIRDKKSFYYLGGLTEGTETFVLFVLLCLLPDAFTPLAVFFGILCWITTASRITWAWTTLRDI